jgi:hypothetical protein
LVNFFINSQLIESSSVELMEAVINQLLVKYNYIRKIFWYIISSTKFFMFPYKNVRTRTRAKGSGNSWLKSMKWSSRSLMSIGCSFDDDWMQFDDSSFIWGNQCLLCVKMWKYRWEWLFGFDDRWFVNIEFVIVDKIEANPAYYYDVQ